MIEILPYTPLVFALILLYTYKLKNRRTDVHNYTLLETEVGIVFIIPPKEQIKCEKKFYKTKGRKGCYPIHKGPYPSIEGAYQAIKVYVRQNL